MRRQKNKKPIQGTSTALTMAKEALFTHSDVFCASGVGLAVGILIGLTFNCIILL